ncbi:acyl-CoA dehydrogenase family protein [Kitasatospora sp. NPDC087314]|uniref:acyl-CoA dehydrogenase family protein n=1 Tax=Kitasatospora sp. NPDC087314 TaxID=3364068 RepID=UPI0037FD6688
MLGVSLTEITLTDYEFDPEEDVLGGWGHDLTGSLLGHDVTGYTARAVGSADAVVDHALRFVCEGLDHRSPEVRAAIRVRVGEPATTVAVMRTVWRALLDPEPCDAGAHPGMSSEAAKVFCTTALRDVVRQAASLCGGAGYAGADGPLGRHYRDALALLIVGAPNDVLLSRIGERELGPSAGAGPLPG